jgi:Holliday junction DNA helicase RuvA
MIARLRGTVAEIGPDRLTVDVGGVGYDVCVPGRTAETATLEGTIVLHVHTAVREDAITLYGFASAVEKVTFELLIGVNQVGPKLALATLGAMPPAELGRAIEGNDLRALTAIPGVGKKTAERLVLELRGKLAWVPAPSPVAVVRPAPDDPLPLALAQLGYKKSEIDLALAHLVEHGLNEAPLQERLGAALKRFASGTRS